MANFVIFFFRSNKEGKEEFVIRLQALFYRLLQTSKCFLGWKFFCFFFSFLFFFCSPLSLRSLLKKLCTVRKRIKVHFSVVYCLERSLLAIAHHYAVLRQSYWCENGCAQSLSRLPLLPRKNAFGWSWKPSWDGPFVTHPMRKKAKVWLSIVHNRKICRKKVMRKVKSSVRHMHSTVI